MKHPVIAFSVGTTGSFLLAISCGGQRSIESLYTPVESSSALHSELIHFQDSVSGEMVVSEFRPMFKLPSVAFPRFANWSDPLFLQQWFLENRGEPNGEQPYLYQQSIAGADIRMPANWGDFPIVRPAVLAVLDTGVDFSHPDINPEKFFVNLGESGVGADGLN
jgi:hypothetical protein